MGKRDLERFLDDFIEDRIGRRDRHARRTLWKSKAESRGVVGHIRPQHGERDAGAHDRERHVGKDGNR